MGFLFGGGGAKITVPPAPITLAGAPIAPPAPIAMAPVAPQTLLATGQAAAQRSAASAAGFSGTQLATAGSPGGLAAGGLTTLTGDTNTRGANTFGSTVS
jgi:hypothetical protein